MRKANTEAGKGFQGPPDSIPKLVIPALRLFSKTERQKQNLGHVAMDKPFKCPSSWITRALNSSMGPQGPVLESKSLSVVYPVLRNPVSPQTHFPATLPRLCCNYKEGLLGKASSPHPNWQRNQVLLKGHMSPSEFDMGKVMVFTLF